MIRRNGTRPLRRLHRFRLSEQGIADCAEADFNRRHPAMLRVALGSIPYAPSQFALWKTTLRLFAGEQIFPQLSANPFDLRFRMPEPTFELSCSFDLNCWPRIKAYFSAKATLCNSPVIYSCVRQIQDSESSLPQSVKARPRLDEEVASANHPFESQRNRSVRKTIESLD